jgi:hypothetical protein
MFFKNPKLLIQYLLSLVFVKGLVKVKLQGVY